MVDAERLARILARVRDDVRTLRRLDAEHDLTVDETALAALKYTFVTAIEGCARAASHVISSERLGVPESSAGSIRMLGVHGIVPVDLAASVALASGFRNVLVHEYTAVDDDAVRGNLRLTGDLDAFVVALAAWAAGADGARP